MCATLTVTALGALAASPASAQTSPQPFAPYDGSNPFTCELQDVGAGTDYPDPDADPLCVEFDKTNQNVTDLGLVEFLANEPARTAAAIDKCFYFQRDHWTGSIVQGEDPELWHWDGNYFFDRARGIGGVSFANLRLGGEAYDARPYVPDPYKPFLYEGGGGGGVSQLELISEPRCVAMVDTPRERRGVYRDEPVFPRCVPPGGELRGRRVGRVALGMRRGEVVGRLGKPREHGERTDRWCVTGAANLWTAYRGEGLPTALIKTSSYGHTERGVGVGTPMRRAKRRLDLERRFEIGSTRVFEAERRHGRRLFAGARGHRLRWLAVVDPDRLRDLDAIERALHRTQP